MAHAKILRSGDGAVTLEFGTVISEEISRDVLGMDALLTQNPIPGIIETIPTYCSLLILYDPSILRYPVLCEELQRRLQLVTAADDPEARLWEIPCCYGSHFGLDMDEVCRHTGFTKEEVIERHCSIDYRIYMLGFLPGFVYLGGMDPALEVPRLSVPRTEIPRGSVGIGGKQTGIYPMASPGGWHLIGATPIELYDPMRENPVLFKPGDHIRFEPISSSAYYDIRQEMQRGTYVPVSRKLKL